MTLIDQLEEHWARVVKRLEQHTWIPALLMRVFVGGFFFETGLSKVQNLDAMTQRFIEWGIPAPAFNAALSGYTELIGGALVVLGLMTRLASVPMVINMVVAVVTVKAKELSSITDFLELDEPLYALAFLWLAFAGPGRASLDKLLLRLRTDLPASTRTEVATSNVLSTASVTLPRG